MDFENKNLTTLWTFIKDEQYAKAYRNIVNIIDSDSANKHSLENLFAFVFNNYVNLLHNIEDFKAMFGCFEKALEYYPENSSILSNLACSLQR